MAHGSCSDENLTSNASSATDNCDANLDIRCLSTAVPMPYSLLVHELDV